MKHVAVIYIYICEIRNWTSKVHSIVIIVTRRRCGAAQVIETTIKKRNCEIQRTARSRATYVNACIGVLYTNEIRYSDHNCLSGKRGLRLVFSWSPQTT